MELIVKSFLLALPGVLMVCGGIALLALIAWMILRSKQSKPRPAQKGILFL